MVEELPDLCRKCAKPVLLRPDGRCRFCNETGLEEDVFCYLNRCCQDPASFQCHGFQPGLRLVEPSEIERQGISRRSEGPSREEIVSGFLQSDHAKYQKALALQHLKEDPDGIFMDIKYHFAWNVSRRMPVFRQADDFFDFAYDTFLSCSDAVKGFAGLHWLAPDHVHLYIESDGELSVEAMIKEVKAFSRKSFIEKYPDLMEKNGERPVIWDDAYFAETIG